jgi:hypothetical protein
MSFVTGPSSAWAGKISYPSSCQELADHYLIKHDQTPDEIGGRLWNLDQLSQDWSLGRGDKDCVQQIYQQAINDGFEYWNKIGEDYHCKDKSAGKRAKVCSGRFGFDENFNFLNVMKQILELPQGSGCSKTGSAASAQPEEPVAALGKNMAPIIARVHNPSTGDSGKKSAKKSGKSAAQAASNPKDVASPSIEKRTEQKEKPSDQKGKSADQKTKSADIAPAVAGPTGTSSPSFLKTALTCTKEEANRSTEEAIAVAGVGCFAGFIDQIGKEIWDLVSGAVKSVVHLGDTINALSDLISELRRNPEVVLGQIIETYMELLPGDNCKSAFEKNVAYCRVAGKVVADVFSLVYGGTVVKVGVDTIKMATRLAIKAGEKGAKIAAPVARVGGKLVPNAIKTPVKAAASAAATKATAAGSAVADTVALTRIGAQITSEAMMDSVEASIANAKKFGTLQAEKAIMYTQSTQTGQTLLKVGANTVAVMTTNKAGKIVTKVTKWGLKTGVKVGVGSVETGIVVAKKLAIGLPLIAARDGDLIKKYNKEFPQKVKEKELMEQHKINEEFKEDANSMLMEANSCLEIAKAYHELTTKYHLNGETCKTMFERGEVNERKVSLDKAVHNLSTAIYHCEESKKEPAKQPIK